MLIQASNFDIIYNSSYIEYVRRRKNPLYSIWGDNCPVKPYRRFFPKTDFDINIYPDFIETSSNKLILRPTNYGYDRSGIVISTTPDINMFYNFTNSSSENINSLYPLFYGYPSDGIGIISPDINMNPITFSQDFNPINI